MARKQHTPEEKARLALEAIRGCKCQYKNVQKEENINVQSTASSFGLLSFHDRSFVLETIRGTFDGNDYRVMQ